MSSLRPVLNRIRMDKLSRSALLLWKKNLSRKKIENQATSPNMLRRKLIKGMREEMTGKEVNMRAEGTSRRTRDKERHIVIDTHSLTGNKNMIDPGDDRND